MFNIPLDVRRRVRYLLELFPVFSLYLFGKEAAKKDAASTGAISEFVSNIIKREGWPQNPFCFYKKDCSNSLTAKKNNLIATHLISRHAQKSLK